MQVVVLVQVAHDGAELATHDHQVLRRQPATFPQPPVKGSALDGLQYEQRRPVQRRRQELVRADQLRVREDSRSRASRTSRRRAGDSRRSGRSALTKQQQFRAWLQHSYVSRSLPRRRCASTCSPGASSDPTPKTRGPALGGPGPAAAALPQGSDSGFPRGGPAPSGRSSDDAAATAKSPAGGRGAIDLSHPRDLPPSVGVEPAVRLLVTTLPPPSAVPPDKCAAGPRLIHLGSGNLTCRDSIEAPNVTSLLPCSQHMVSVVASCRGGLRSWGIPPGGRLSPPQR